MSNLDREIDLWAPQMGEHALFLHLLLHDLSLKQKALDLFHKWQLYICQGKPGGAQKALSLIDELSAFKLNILSRLNNGEWIGAVYPQFVDHIHRELLYFRNKLLGIKMSPADEVQFWNTINSEHAGFASHLLDPTEEELVDKADATMKKIRDLPVASIVMAIEAGIDLLNFNIEAYNATLANQIKSIIHPTLLRHVIREGQIGNNVLAKFANSSQLEVVVPDICKTQI